MENAPKVNTKHDKEIIEKLIKKSKDMIIEKYRSNKYKESATRIKNKQ